MKELTCGEARDMASDLIDGELEPEEVARLQAHVESCPTCPRLYRALVAVTAELSRLQRIQAEGD